MENEQKVHDLKVQLTTVQGHHKESMDQLGEKSRHLAALKTDLAKSQQQNQALSDEVGICNHYSILSSFDFRNNKLSDFRNNKLSVKCLLPLCIK